MKLNENHITSKFGGKTPIYFTKSFGTFSEELTENIFLLYYILILDKYLDKRKKSKALDELILRIRDPENQISVKLTDILKNDVNFTFFDSNYYERIIGQMTLCRYVDNFLCYLKDVLVEVVNKNPNVLKSSETEKLDDILSFETIQELREFIIDKKLKALFYKNIDDINRFFTEKLGLDVMGNSKEGLNLLIKQRNLIVHNRAKITDDLAASFAGYKNHMGEQLVFSYGELEDILLFLNNLAADIDTKLIEKFNLEKVKNPLI